MTDPIKHPYYDDPVFSYPAFWHGRDYEHLAEVSAIRKFLGRKKFAAAVDIGGGFGRLAPLLLHVAQTVTLVEPSTVQRALAERAAGGKIKVVGGSAAHTSLPDSSYDLVVMVRVMHHIPKPEESIAEIYRILKPGGTLILEFANSHHMKARLKRGMKLQTTPLEPIQVNDESVSDVPFVNHHPAAIRRALTQQGFVIDRTLSVSNMRSPFLKRVLPLGVLLGIEGLMQRSLAWLSFGPSMFVLAHKPQA